MPEKPDKANLSNSLVFTHYENLCGIIQPISRCEIDTNVHLSSTYDVWLMPIKIGELF